MSASRIDHGLNAGQLPFAIEGVDRMGTFQFADTIRQLYLPFTLRQMYYKELKKRKPIFLGASKKGVGFNGPTLLNERTCLWQTQATLA